jgi:hypothetical protein
LNLAENKLIAKGTTLLPNGWVDKSYAANWGEQDEHWETDMAGITALADVIPSMRALTSLNLSSNNLMAEGGKIVAEAIKVTNIVMAVVLVPFLCPSNHLITG